MRRSLPRRLRASLSVALCAICCALWPACDKAEPAPEPEPKPTSVAPTPPKQVPQPPPVIQEAPAISIVKTSGKVETRRDGKWKRAKPGELTENDALRTTGRGSATVTIGDTKVVVERNSEISVQENTPEAANLQLEKGRVRAELAEDDRTLRIRAAGSDAVAEAKDGEFAVYNNGRGLVAVASKTGSVKLSSGGGDILLAAGEQAQVKDAGKPQKQRVREAILLSVVWPGKKTDKRNTIIRGKADVGATVEVNGQEADVGPDGTFKASVRLAEGRNAVSISARDLLGREKTREGRIELDSKPPDVAADTQNLWDKKKP